MSQSDANSTPQSLPATSPQLSQDDAQDLSSSWEMIPEQAAAASDSKADQSPLPPVLSLAGRKPDADALREVKLSDDGEAIKAVLVEGKGELPPVMSRAYVLVKGMLPDGTIFLDSSTEEFDFIIGRGEVALGLQMAVATMLPGERARVHCGVKFGYSDTRRPKNVPANSPIIFDTTLIWAEKETNLHEMEMKDKLDYIKQRREIGKRQYQEGKVSSALKQYERALLVIGDGLRPDGQAAESDKQLSQEVKELWVVHLNNAALCQSKLGRHSEVVKNCEKALQFDPNNIKSLVRRADAYRQLTDYEEALRDYKRCLALVQSSSASDLDTDLVDRLKDKINSTNQLRVQQTKQHMKTYSNMFKQEIYEDKPVVPASRTQTCAARLRRGCSMIGSALAFPFVSLAAGLRSLCRTKPTAKKRL